MAAKKNCLYKHGWEKKTVRHTQIGNNNRIMQIKMEKYFLCSVFFILFLFKIYLIFVYGLWFSIKLNNFTCFVYWGGFWRWGVLGIFLRSGLCSLLYLLLTFFNFQCLTVNSNFCRPTFSIYSSNFQSSI
jgi:hypothetical protein